MIFNGRGFFFFTLPLSQDSNAPSSPSGSSDIYLKKKIALSITSFALTLVYLGLLAFTGLKAPFIRLSFISHNIFLSFLIFVFAVEIVLSIIKFPVDYCSDFVMEHNFSLSNQPFLKWVLRKMKIDVVGGIVGLVVLIIFYALLVNFQRSWWILFAVFFFLFQILVAQLFPTLILPLFYRLKPLDKEELKSRLQTLVEKFGYRMNGVFSFDLSRETKKANAAMTGLGKTRKIIISDTLLDSFSAGEIEVVMAHELGHLVKHHMMKGIALSAAVSVIGFFVVAQAYSAYAEVIHAPVYALNTLPFLAVLMSILGVISVPVGNYYSRRIEHEADLFALDTTGMNAEFVETMRKLGKLNLSPENPPAWIEKIFFSHPSIGARIKSALDSEEGRSNRPSLLENTK